MKLVPTYTIKPPLWADRGIDLTDGRIVVGEEGRNRRMVSVPLPPGAVVEKGTVTAVPTQREEIVAVVLIRDFSGYAGTWQLVAPVADELLREYAEAQRSDVLAELQEVAPRYEIARGRRAQGMAGRVGYSDEILFMATAGEAYDIVRWGWVYGAPRVVRLTVHADGTVTVRDAVRDLLERDAAARWM